VYRALEHPRDELRPLLLVQPVGVHEQGHLSCPHVGRGKAAQGGHVFAVELAVEPDGFGDLSSRSTGPANSQSMKATGTLLRATMFQGPTSPWPKTGSSFGRCVYHGIHTASCGGSKLAVAS
jgi:hypothetical protein